MIENSFQFVDDYINNLRILNIDIFISNSFQVSRLCWYFIDFSMRITCTKMRNLFRNICIKKMNIYTIKLDRVSDYFYAIFWIAISRDLHQMSRFSMILYRFLDNNRLILFCLYNNAIWRCAFDNEFSRCFASRQSITEIKNLNFDRSCKKHFLFNHSVRSTDIRYRFILHTNSFTSVSCDRQFRYI